MLARVSARLLAIHVRAANAKNLFAVARPADMRRCCRFLSPPQVVESGSQMCGLFCPWGLRRASDANPPSYGAYKKVSAHCGRCSRLFTPSSSSLNLHVLLVKAQLPVISNYHLPPGSFRCGQNCATGPYITNGLTTYPFYVTGETRAITSHISL